jgi:hypothetical protein
VSIPLHIADGPGKSMIAMTYQRLIMMEGLDAYEAISEAKRRVAELRKADAIMKEANENDLAKGG